MQCFIFYRRPELARPATTLYQHNLTGILETAVRATNAQYDNAEILKRLDVRLLEVMYECVCVCVHIIMNFFNMSSLLSFVTSRCLQVIQAGMYLVWITMWMDLLLR